MTDKIYVFMGRKKSNDKPVVVLHFLIENDLGVTFYDVDETHFNWGELLLLADQVIEDSYFNYGENSEQLVKKLHCLLENNSSENDENLSFEEIFNLINGLKEDVSNINLKIDELNNVVNKNFNNVDSDLDPEDMYYPEYKEEDYDIPARRVENFYNGEYLAEGEFQPSIFEEHNFVKDAPEVYESYVDGLGSFRMEVPLSEEDEEILRNGYYRGEF